MTMPNIQDINAYFELLRDYFSLINQNNDVLEPTDPAYPRNNITIPGFNVEISNGSNVPVPVEVARILRRLRQRFDTNDPGNDLVQRFRAEIRRRERPIRNVPLSSVSGDMGNVARIIAGNSNISDFSQFQVDGWRVVLQGIESARQGQENAVVVTAPTGAGKTEVFMAPLLYAIASSLNSALHADIPHFLILYPRTALAQDQIARVFRYAREAENSLCRGHHICIGLQFYGIFSNIRDTLNRSTFFRRTSSSRDYEFTVFDNCPWCRNNVRLTYQNRNGLSFLVCPQCQNEQLVSLSKDSHRDHRPHIMISTAESLDNLLLDYDFREYLPQFHGVILDEAHIYHGLYGAHVHHLLRRLRGLIQRYRQPFWLASSATISEPDEFARKLFFSGGSLNPVTVINASDPVFPQETNSLEVVYFLQAPETTGGSRSQSTAIQTAMALGHGLLRNDQRIIVFADSLNIVGRYVSQLRDAEINGELWRFRSDRNRSSLSFNGTICPATSPNECRSIYWAGECWRGILGGTGCHQSITGYRSIPLTVSPITGKTSIRRLETQVVVGTSALEVGIDDPNVQVVIQQRPPRTVFSFIQRRGRAGRQNYTIAYSVVVLGQEPSDHFYIVRRHRLLDGRYQLPLNPENPVISQIHDALDETRRAAFSHIVRHGEGDGIWQWMIARLLSCEYLSSHAIRLQNILRIPSAQRKDSFRDWVRSGISQSEQQLDVHWNIRRIRDRISDLNLISLLDDADRAFQDWLDESLNDQEFQNRTNDLIERLALLTQTILRSPVQNTNLQEVTNAMGAIQSLNQFAQRGREEARNVLNGARAWFDFYSRLNELFEEPYTILMLNSVVRKVLQSLYLLYEGLSEYDNRPNDVSVYVPENYFGGIRPMQIELPARNQPNSSSGRTSGANQQNLPVRDTEAVSLLSSVFSPFSLTYRYQADLLFALSTENTRAQNNRLYLRPRATGPRVSDPENENRQVIRVRGITLQAIACDSRQQIGVCPNCYRLYDLQLAHQQFTCECGFQIQEGRIQVEETYVRHGTSEESRLPVRIGSSFMRLDSLRVWTKVQGARIVFRPSRGREQRITAWLNKPLYYETITKGIRWQVPNLPEDLDARIEWLHAAAHVLLKSMASIVGVREDQLAYQWNERAGTVTVSEQVEGGGGLSEVFSEYLQLNPLQVYQEFVRSIACPIYLSENHNVEWQSVDELRDRLSVYFRLPPDDEVINDIIDEALAESRQNVQDIECASHDGCPVCIHTNECTQDSPPRRSIAWEVVQSLVQSISSEQWSNQLAQGIINPPIYIDETQGIYYVLVF